MQRPIGAAILTLTLVATTACVSPEAHRELTAANDTLRRDIDALGLYHNELEAENTRLRGEVERLGKNAVEADYIRARKEELAGLIAKFQQGGTSAVPGVSVISTPEGVGFQLQGEVLFNSGMTKITTAGQGVLGQLIPALERHGRAIRIIGHTDADPIRRSQWKTNMRLSAERAMAVISFLGKRGMDASLLHIAAFGAHQPAVAGDTAEAKRQNRRVEILMLRE